MMMPPLTASISLSCNTHADCVGSWEASSILLIGRLPEWGVDALLSLVRASGSIGSQCLQTTGVRTVIRQSWRLSPGTEQLRPTGDDAAWARTLRLRQLRSCVGIFAAFTSLTVSSTSLWKYLTNSSCVRRSGSTPSLA